MAWAVKYRGEFYDLKGLYWRIEIEEDAFAGAITEMKMGGSPLTIEHMAGGDDLLLNPIKGSQAIFTVISETSFQWVGLYSSENLKYRCSIYTVYNTTATLYWRGYLTADYEEPYGDTPYMVSVTATDALGILKDIKYDDAGTPYDGRRYESQVILDCLGKIGFTAFNEFINVYEDRISDTSADSPLDQIQIDVDVFRDMYCYEVLEEVLKKYNAVIRQSRGIFWLYRPTELKTSGDVYYRAFTAYDTKTDDALSPAPDQYVKRTGVASNIWNFQGGKLMLQSPLRLFTANQDYGYRMSWLENWAIESTRWTGDTPYGWTNTGLGKPVNTTSLTKTERDGIIFSPASAVPNSQYYCYQDFGTNAVVTSNQFLIEFEYMFVNLSSVSDKDAKVAIRINDVAETYWLDNKNDAECEWKTIQKHVDVTVVDVPIGKGSWTRFTRSFTGLPVAGPYRLTLFPSSNTGHYLAYRNIRFTNTSDEMILHIPTMNERYAYSQKVNKSPITFNSQGLESYVETVENEEIVSATYLGENSIVGGEATQGYILGDVADTGITNVIDQFRGSLCGYMTEGLTEVADDFVADHAAAYLTGGVVVTSLGRVITFTGNSLTGFTGSTTIVNAAGDLSGTVANVQAAAAVTNEQHTIQLAGTSGTLDITVEGVTATATYATSPTQTATNFVTNFTATYAAVNVTVTSSGDTLTFEADNGSFTSDSYVTEVIANLTGDVDLTAQAYAEGTNQIDTITLTGSSGSANILCDGVTRAVDVTAGTALRHSTSWHTRGATEAKPVIELVTDEIAAQYAREKHFIQMNIREEGTTAPDVNVVYNVQDNLNQLSGQTRVFAVNRGTLDVFNREWSLDIIEII